MSLQTTGNKNTEIVIVSSAATHHRVSWATLEYELFSRTTQIRGYKTLWRLEKTFHRNVSNVCIYVNEIKSAEETVTQEYHIILPHQKQKHSTNNFFLPCAVPFMTLAIPFFPFSCLLQQLRSLPYPNCYSLYFTHILLSFSISTSSPFNFSCQTQTLNLLSS